MTAKVRMELTWRGRYVEERERFGLMQGLDAGADHLLDAALEITPFETDYLADTGIATTDASQLKAAVSFDGEYAVWQHEDLDLEHDAGRSAKYLETPFYGEKDEILRIIARELGASLR